jgi:hypothetical protein
MRYFYFILFLFLSALNVLAQPAIKKLNAVKTTIAPKIDGLLDDEIWKNAQVATDFVELNPTAGRHEKPEERTEVRILYDNTAIYVGARMYETSSSKVAHELVNRDNVGNSDFLGIVLDTYLDGINASGFYVTAAGVQFDAKYAPNPNGNNEDPTWNAVWQSAVHIDADGWTAEFRIPYSALRFPKKDIQTWGMNITRKRQQEQKQLFWNEIDPKKNGFINQEGQLTHIEKIDPPTRLALYPYFSTYVNHYPYNSADVKNTTSSINGGMDVKYGINQSFTLDVTLIPDFGQVQSDNQVLNLTPFEVKYNENRPFFTEGTELFNKGNLFYSRRIGGHPIDYYNVQLNNHEAVIQNPSESRLLNATKFSGRTASGLGIGVLNAITQSTSAIVKDSVTGQRRMVQTAPTTNYNILVLDQNLKNNSSVTLVNTNVTRFGKDYNSDVGGFVFNLNNKKNSYDVTGYGFMSNLMYPGKDDLTGYSYEVGGGKTLGNFTWSVYEDFASSNYNPNDLGILNNPNYLDHNINLQYANYKPKKYFTQWNVYSNIYYSRRVVPSAEQALNFNGGGNFNLKNFWNVYFNLSRQQTGHDFYSPRDSGLFYNTPATFGMGGGLNTNHSKRLYGGVFFFYRFLQNNSGGNGYDAEVYYTLRISDHFSFGEDVTYSPRNFYDDYFTTDNLNHSVYSLFNRSTVENVFNLKYTFNNRMGLTLRARHYWSKRNNLQYYNLQTSGALLYDPAAPYSNTNDTNFNTFNVDMVYSWEFKPGSFLSIAYKNSELIDNTLAAQGYSYNLKDTFKQPQNNNLSLKILYYIDYQDLKKHHH